MRQSCSPARALAFGAVVLAVVVGIGGLAAWALTASAGTSHAPRRREPATIGSGEATPSAATTTTTTASPMVATAAPTASVEVLPATPEFDTGNDQLDALLPTLPAVLFDGGAQVRFGYNPADCCHAGGYDPASNVVWVSERALASAASLTYVTVHELAHSLSLHSPRADALTAAVAGAPVVRSGPWDDTEKLADCVAWTLSGNETAASGMTYWDCPFPWRAQVIDALG